ncbi:MAG: DNRLRE domain-containing protein, partial [Kiritimatiellae bacterium]|nr:DNRLRE domain-containing protein [Kiritimatiellia bacterium]
TIVVVGRMLGNHVSNATDIFYDSPSSLANRTIMGQNYYGSNENQFYIHQDTAALVATVTRSVWTNYHIWEAYYNGSSSALYCDGSNVISGTVGSGNLRGLLMGSFYDGHNHGLNGDIAEMRCYGGGPSATERNALGAHLSSKYGLTTSYAFSGNLAPTVTLTSPTDGTNLPAGTVTLTATAGDIEGNVTNVGFYANGVPIATDSTYPYSCSWVPMTKGEYALTARAWADDNSVGTSAVVTVQAQVYAFRVDAGAGADTLIAGGGLANNNYGVASTLEIASAGYTSRSLIQFDVGAFPGGVESVDCIVLRLTTSYVVKNASTVVEAYRVTNSWAEASATWNQRQTGVAWNSGAGGDFDGGTLLGACDWSVLPGSGLVVDASREGFEIEILPGAANAGARLALIKGWKLTANYGLLIKPQAEAGQSGYLGLRSGERTTASDRPELVVYYRPMPEGTVISIR